MYGKVTEKDIEALRAIVGAGEVLVGDAISPDTLTMSSAVSSGCPMSL